MRELKTELTREEVQELCDVYNALESMLDNTAEIFDVDLSTLRDLRRKAYDIRQMFNFRSQVNEEGNPSHWLPSVLPDADNAWHYQEKEKTNA